MKEITVLLSTRNRSKAEQISAMFQDPSIQFLSLADTNIVGEAVEDGLSLWQNASKKARFAHDQYPGDVWAIADDTGLFINTLDGQPGIFSARWAGETATTEEIMAYTLNKLDGVSDRSATFKTVAVIVLPDNRMYLFTGECPGRILEAPTGPCQPNMPYSAIFVPDGQDKSWSQMTVEEENAVSHRGKAFRKVRQLLDSIAFG